MNELELRVIEAEYMFDRREEDDRQADMLTSYTRRFIVDCTEKECERLAAEITVRVIDFFTRSPLLD